MRSSAASDVYKRQPYYKVQNSWNTVPPYDGFWYFSKPFVAYKTTSIMVNKNAIPKEIAQKLGLK